MKYPRDLSGYGKLQPNFLWPNGSIIALQFVINYEEGGERSVTDGDAHALGYGAARHGPKQHLEQIWSHDGGQGDSRMC